MGQTRLLIGLTALVLLGSHAYSADVGDWDECERALSSPDKIGSSKIPVGLYDVRVILPDGTAEDWGNPESVDFRRYSNLEKFQIKFGPGSLSLHHANGIRYVGDQTVTKVSSLPPALEKVARSIIKDLNPTWQEYGFFAFSYGKGQFEVGLPFTSNRSNHLESEKLWDSFETLVSKANLASIAKGYFVHNHPKGSGTFDSLSVDDLESTAAFQEYLRKTLGIDIPFECDAISMRQRSDERMFLRVLPAHNLIESYRALFQPY